jgi:two-component system KDP operon response regulator KdpE
MNNKSKILIVEDEPKVFRFIKEVLTATGFEVIGAGNSQKAIEMFAIEQPDMILLDIILDGEIDGYEVCKRIRGFSDVPIIMLTAKARETDLLQGFNAGADDYITKPFSAKELLARIRAVLSRTKKEVKGEKISEITCGSLHIDLARRQVSRNENLVHLTKTEYDLLRELAVHLNQVVLHSVLLAAVWGPEYRDDLDYLRAYIRYLRKKLEPEPKKPKHIKTIQGVGYMLECPDK